ncbi:MAG: anti-sigma regulatory factor [Desulfobacterales bacterium]|nr:anti-sigma regulatory factor [Desulfobacterales bacterium]
MEEQKVEITTHKDIISARQAGRDIAKKLGFGTADQTRLATAISELTRNVLQYAGKGVCIITDISSQTEKKIKVIVEDNGPGIEDIELALKDGFSTSNGLGAGLPGTKRLVHDFHIESKQGLTKVTIIIKRKAL